jgi:hypothetical protein
LAEYMIQPLYLFRAGLLRASIGPAAPLTAA